jgi:hypothetical protein
MEDGGVLTSQELALHERRASGAPSPTKAELADLQQAAAAAAAAVKAHRQAAATTPPNKFKGGGAALSPEHERLLAKVQAGDMLTDDEVAYLGETASAAAAYGRLGASAAARAGGAPGSGDGKGPPMASKFVVAAPASAAEAYVKSKEDEAKAHMEEFRRRKAEAAAAVAAEEKAKKMAELAQRKAEKVAAAHARREAEKAEAAAAEAAKGSVLHQIGQYFAERFGTAVKQCSGEAKLEAEEMARMEKAAAAFINAAAKAALNTWIEEYDGTPLGLWAPRTHTRSPTPLTPRLLLPLQVQVEAEAPRSCQIDHDEAGACGAQLVGRNGGGEEENRGRHGKNVSGGARQDRR